MRLSVIGLLTLLSSVAFFGTPGSAMHEAEAVGGRIASKKAKDDTEIQLEARGAGGGTSRGELKSSDLDALMRASDVSGIYKTLRRLGNEAPDKDLVAHILGSTWNNLSPEERDSVVSKVTGKPMVADLDTLITKSSAIAIYTALRPSNSASDKDLIGYILRNSGWDKLTPEEKETVVSKVTGRPVATDLDALIRTSNVSNTFKHLRGLGNKTPDKELIGFILRSSGWDRLSTEEQENVVSKVVGKTAVTDLDELIRTSNVSSTFKHLRGLGNKAPDKDLIGFILRSSGWDRLSPEEQELVVSTVTGKLDELIRTSGVSDTFKHLRGLGNKASDKKLIGFILKDSGWNDLSPREQESIVSKITGKPIPPPRAPKPLSRVSGKAASAIPIPPPPPPFDPSFKVKRKSSAKKEQEWSPPPRPPLSKRTSATAGMSKDAFELLQERLKLINRDVSDEDTYESEDKDLPAPPPSSSTLMASEVAPKVKTFDEIIAEKRQEVENINLNIQALKETAEKLIPSGFSRAIKAESRRILNARQAVKDEKDRLISLRFEIERLEQQKIQQEREAVEEGQRSIEKAQRIAEAHRRVLEASSVSDVVGELPPQVEQLAQVKLKKSSPSSKRISTVESPASAAASSSSAAAASSAAASSSTADSMSAFLKKAEALRSKKETEDDNGDDWD